MHQELQGLYNAKFEQRLEDNKKVTHEKRMKKNDN
jgi:hypothetical protein